MEVKAQCISNSYDYDNEKYKWTRHTIGNIYRFDKQTYKNRYLVLTDDTGYLDARFIPEEIFKQLFKIVSSEGDPGQNMFDYSVEIRNIETNEFTVEYSTGDLHDALEWTMKHYNKLDHPWEIRIGKRIF